MNVGGVLSGQKFSWDEAWYLTSPNSVLGPNVIAAPFTVGTFQMPFTGTATADLLVKFNMPGGQWIRPDLSGSTPTPNYRSVFTWWNGLPGGFVYAHDIPVVARWDNLAKDTIITIVCNVTTGGQATDLTVANIGGRVRAYAP